MQRERHRSRLALSCTEPGWAPETQTGSYGAMGGPQVVAEVDADSAADAERLVSEALPDHDYTVTAEPRQ